MAEPERWVNFFKFETISVKHIFINAFCTADNKSGINVVKNKTVEPLRWVDFLNVRTMLLKMIFFYVFRAADNKSIISLAQNKKELAHLKVLPFCFKQIIC